jgi:hypothetical protein
MTKRTRIGRSSGIATRQIIYRTPQGIEIDELDHFEIVRKRVLYDDVLLVTFHRQHGTAYIVFMAVAVLFFGTLAAVTSSVPPLAGSFAAVAGVALVFGVTRFLLQIDVVTVFGRRSKAAIRYPYRKAFARRIYGEICASVAAAQRRLAREAAEGAAEGGLNPHPDLGPPPDQLEGSDLPSASV